MKKLYLLLIPMGMLALIISCQPKQSPPKIKHSGAGIAMDRWFQLRSYPTGIIPNRKYTQAFEAKKLAAVERGGDMADWQAIGPKNIGGRATFLAFHPDHPDTVFLGTASGGLWKTTTAGKGVNAWEQVPTGFRVAGVGSIAIDPNDGDVIYLGTGEAYNFDISAPGTINRLTRGIPGIGILKSTDGGLTWSKSMDWSYEDGTGVQDLLINPLNANTVFAATKDGVFRTRDAGASWVNIHNFDMAVDLEMHPQDTNVVFVTHGNFNGSSAAGIYRSIDGGDSFQKLGGGLPNTFSGKTLLSISPSNPRTLYASVADAFASKGLFKSIDGGDSWTNVNAQDVARYQGWFAHDVAINPFDENALVYVGVDAFRSLDGGTTLTQEGFWYKWAFGQVPVGGPEGPPDYVHADIHMAKYHPTDTNVVFLATDGGVFVSKDNGDNWEGRNGGLQTQQFYANFSNSTTDSLFAIGGMQDNATAIYTGDDAWVRVLGGDGMCTAIHPQNDSIIYGSSQFLRMYSSLDRGDFFFEITPPNLVNEQAVFSGPFELAPSNPSILYAGGQSLFRSTDAGFTWTTPANMFADGSNSIHNIAVSPLNPSLVYLSTAPYALNSPNKPQLLKSVNGGAAFTYMTGLPDRPIPDIVFDPVNDSIVYVVLSGFGTDHVYKTTDAGKSWFSRSNNLPDVPTNTILVDPVNPDFVYVGSDAGVYFSPNGGMDWELFDEGLPEAAIAFHLSVSQANRKLRIATHGNGVYESPMVEAGISAGNDEVLLQDQIIFAQNFPNPVVDKTTFSMELPFAVEGKLVIYNTQGQVVKMLFQEKFSRGKHSRQADLSSLSSGVYRAVLKGSILKNGEQFRVSKALVKE